MTSASGGLDLAARLAEGAGRRQQPQPGGQRRHQDRNEAVDRALDHGGLEVDGTLPPQPPDAAHEHDPVAGRDAEQCDEADEPRDRQDAAAEEYPGHAADERQGEVDHHHRCVAGGPERAKKEEEDAGDGPDAQPEQQARGGGGGFELAAVLHAVSPRAAPRRPPPRSRMSEVTLPRSRPAMLAVTRIRRWAFSRPMKFGLRSSAMLARLPSGTRAPCGMSSLVCHMASRS